MLFDIDFYKFWVNNTPTQRRKPKRNARGKVYMRPLMWLRELTYVDKMTTGAGAVVWSVGATYTELQKVVYNDNRQLYQVLEGATPPAGTLPTDATYWRLLSTNWVGMDWQRKATAEKLKLEYYLNLYFGSTFRQPPLVSDIYIQTTLANNYIFYAGISESESSSVTYFGENINGAVWASNNPFSQYNYTIYVPSALYASLGANNDIRNTKIREQVNPRNLQSITYTITTY